MFDLKIKIDSIFENVLDPSYMGYILNEGLETLLDTHHLMNDIEFENYSAEEQSWIRSKAGQYQVLV